MEQIKYDVFISYSRKDYVDEQKNVIPNNEVSKIKEALTKAKITYWFDEDGVYSGDEFAKVIVKNIKASRVFVFLSTQNSNRSEWTASEISTANMLKKKIIPVRIDDSVYHDDVILYLSRRSHIDYSSNPEKGREELVRSIQAYLEEVRATEEQKKADERRRVEELERQRREQEEAKERQKRIEELETKIAALESQKTERKKVVLQKEQELKLAQVDLEECENKIQKLQNKVQELREPKKRTEQQVQIKPVSQTVGVEAKKKVGEIREKEKIFRVNGVSFRMLGVDGGSFMMGCEKGSVDEKPTHAMRVDDFYLAVSEVTQALWKAVMGNNPSKFIGDKLPVENVSWNDCQIFIQKLNDLLVGDLAGKKFRLPTEAEWEFAARGGNRNLGCRYAGKNSVGDVAWFDGNSNGKPHPVKMKTSNQLGLYDMSGNVWEWCEDWYGDYSSGSNNNPKGPESGMFRVLRGGSWNSGASLCTVSYRNYYEPDDRYFDCGFRLALDVN